MSVAEGQDPAETDPIDLQLPRGATSSGTPQTSTPSVTRLIDTKSLLQVTPYHGYKASFLGRQIQFMGQFSLLWHGERVDRTIM